MQHSMDPAGDSGRTKGAESDYDLSNRSRAQVCTVKTDLFSMWRVAKKELLGNYSSHTLCITRVLISSRGSGECADWFMRIQ